jgi:hypothetical protein
MSTCIVLETELTFDPGDELDMPLFQSTVFFTIYAGDWRMTPYSLRIYWWFATSLALLITCYGRLHVLAWSAHFPTNIEAYAWKVSALMTAASGLIPAVKIAYDDVWKIP